MITFSQSEQINSPKKTVVANRVKEFSNASRNDYARSVRSHIYGYWSGVEDEFTFVDNMSYAIQRGFRRAWLEGAKECGITEADLTEEETNELNRQINQEITFLPGFAAAIARESKENKGKLTPLYNRGEMWVNRYYQVFLLAQQMACGDQRMMWVLGMRKVHCQSCLKLNGRVYRNSVWYKYGIIPGARNLECGGWRCGCTLVKTDLPCTPGRPPALP